MSTFDHYPTVFFKFAECCVRNGIDFALLQPEFEMFQNQHTTTLVIFRRLISSDKIPTLKEAFQISKVGNHTEITHVLECCRFLVLAGWRPDNFERAASRFLTQQENKECVEA